MKKNIFPIWAPEDVILEWENKLKETRELEKRFPLAESDNSEVELLFRLLTYIDMKSVWKKLPKYDIKPALFSSMVQLSILYRETKPYNLTPKDYDVWINDVKATALKLQKLVQFSDYDRIFQEKYFTKRQKHMAASIVNHATKLFHPDMDVNEFEKLVPAYKSWPDLKPQLLSEALQEIVDLESDNKIGHLGVKNHTSVKLGKPNHPNAKRTYFIKMLTQLLREQTGQPLRKIVTITTATVFDNPSLSEREIIRTAP